MFAKSGLLLVHDSHQQVLDLHQLLRHPAVLSHVDLLVGAQLVHYQLHLALQLHHLLDLPLLHLHVAADLSQDLLLPLQQSPVVLEQLASLLRLLSVLLDALQ